jgi:hypothetical protein
VSRNTGIIHQQIERSELLHDALDHGPYFAVQRNIGLESHGVAALIVDQVNPQFSSFPGVCPSIGYRFIEDIRQFLLDLVEMLMRFRLEIASVFTGEDDHHFPAAAMEASSH